MNAMPQWARHAPTLGAGELHAEGLEDVCAARFGRYRSVAVLATVAPHAAATIDAAVDMFTVS